jgi:hypothetical protein
MRSPIPSEFAIVDAGVARIRLRHMPTKTDISFFQNRETGALLGTVSISHHGTSGNFGDYAEAEITAKGGRSPRGF